MLAAGQGCIRYQGRKVIGEHERALVVGISDAPCPFVARTQIAGRFIARPFFSRGPFNLAIPGALGTAWRNQYPLAGEHIAAPVGMLVYRKSHAGFDPFWL
jgi:hypothetical protein